MTAGSALTPAQAIELLPFSAVFSGFANEMAASGLGSYCYPMRLVVEIDREEDGRFIAEVPALPGVLAYGATREAAIAAAKALALRVVADRIEHGELSLGDDLSFAAA